MISLDSGQEQIAGRDNALMVTLVKLNTFSDYTAETIDETFYWSSLPIQYQWDGITTNTFRGLLKSVSPIARGFSHIPDAAELATRDAMSIELDASVGGGEFTWNRLTGKNLIGAKIEVASLLLDLASPRPDNWQDQSALGAVHVVRFRGEVTEVPEYDDESNEFGLTCESIEPVMNWPAALNEDEVSQRDLGKLYPIPVGAAKRVPLVQREVGWTTTLVSAIDEFMTGNVAVTDTTGFPDSPALIDLSIGTETIRAEKVNDTTIEIINRGTTVGQVNTDPHAHNAGAVMIEMIDSARFVYAGIDTFGLSDLYVRSPNSGELVLIPESLYGFMPADKELDTGKTLGVVAFTPGLWSQLVRLLNNEAKVTQQSNFVDSTSVRSESPNRTSVATATGLGTGDESNATILSGINGRVEWSSSLSEGLYFYWLNGDLSSTADVVVRFRMHVQYAITADPSVHARFRIQTSGSMLGSSVSHSYTLTAGSPLEVRSIVTAWADCPASTTVADMLNGATFNNSNPAIQFYSTAIGPTTNTMRVDITRANVSIEMEIEGSGVSQTQEASITGAQEVGFNLDLYADILGAITLGTESSETQMDQIEQGTFDWTGGNATLADFGSPGDGVTSTGAGTDILRSASLLGISPVLDFTGARFKFDYRMTSGSWDILDFSEQALQIEVASSGTDYVIWGWSKASLYPGGWKEFSFGVLGSGAQIVEGGGTIDFSAITKIAVHWQAQSASNGGAVSFRDLRIEPFTYHTHPIDVAEWLIEENAGQAGAADATTFATAKTNLPGVVVSGDLRASGATFSEVLARLGHECRTNFLPSEASGGTVYKAFNALPTYAFPASSKTLSEFRSLKTRTKTLDEQVTEFMGVYNFRNDLSGGDVEGFRALIQANATTNDIITDVPTVDITNAQARVGVRPSEPVAFILLPDSASVVEVFAYYVQESLRGNAMGYSIRVPHSIGYGLEAGDIVAFMPRWSSSAIKCRLINTVFPFDEPSIGLNLEEVL